MSILNKLQAARSENKHLLGVLIDPDKCKDKENLIAFLKNCENAKADILFIGGSLITSSVHESLAEFVKKHTRIPIVLFPGDPAQLDPNADGLLLLSLISGRNPEYLIGSHVKAAHAIRKSGLEIIPTGYMLIESGKITTALYISGTLPVPHNKPEVAASTALAGEMLGLKVFYLDAGSGAEKCVSENMINAVRETVQSPLIVGGGIRTYIDAKKAWDAGADLVMIGTLFEDSPEAIFNFQKRN